MKKIIVFWGILLFISGCKKADSTSEPDFSTKTIQWNLTKDFEIRDIVKDMQYIILEETPESIFSYIYKLIIKNDRIYILDIRPKALLVFDIKGKFLHKIGGQGNGPGEYSNSIINFTVGDNNEVYLYDYSKRNMMKYDEFGKHISSDKSIFSFNDFLILKDNQFMLSSDIYGKDNLNRKIILTNNLKKIKKGFLNFDKDYKHDKLNMVTFQPFEDKIAYMRPVNDTLYVFNNKGLLEQAWFFDFGNRKLPEELKNDYERAVRERRQGGNYDYILNTPICIKNYIITEMLIGEKKCISVYDTFNNKLTHEFFTPDKFSLSNINMPLCTISDSILASYLNAETYYSFKEHISINPEVDAHLKNGGIILILNTIK